MWYSSLNDELLNLIRDGEAICNVRFAGMDSALREEDRSKIGDISAIWLKKALNYVLPLFKRKGPRFELASDAMLRFLNGSGEDVRIPDEDLSMPMRANMVRAVLQRGKASDNDFTWPPGAKMKAPFTYGDYPIVGGADYIFKGAQDNVLKYVIGGFTENVWYEMNESGGIDVFAKFEDVYDWDQDAAIRIDLNSFGLDSPIFMKILRQVASKLNGVELDDNVKVIRVGDVFWKHLQDLGYAKPYKHYYEGKLFSLSADWFAEAATPQEMIETAGQLSIENARTFPILKKVIESGFDSISNYSLMTREDIAKNFLYGTYSAYTTITVSDLPELLRLLNMSLEDVYNASALMRMPENDLLDLFLDAGIAKIQHIVMYLNGNEKKALYLVHNYWNEISSLPAYSLSYLMQCLNFDSVEAKKVQALIDAEKERTESTETKRIRDLIDAEKERINMENENVVQ